VNTECVGQFYVFCFQVVGLQRIALFDKERVVLDKQKPYNKMGKVTGAVIGYW